jgi:hypothetical protein
LGRKVRSVYLEVVRRLAALLRADAGGGWGVMERREVEDGGGAVVVE